MMRIREWRRGYADVDAANRAARRAGDRVRVVMETPLGVTREEMCSGWTVGGIRTLRRNERRDLLEGEE